MLGALLLGTALEGAAPARAEERTFQQLTTGNGHGFQVFDRETRRITTFLEHPYRYVAPGTPARTWGVGRRNLAHDAYFGISRGERHVWLAHEQGQTDVSYEQESHIIHGRSGESGLVVDTYYFAPFGYEGNALLSLIRVHNPGSSAADARVVFKPNLKLGSAGDAREAPSDDSEILSFSAAATPAHAIETGAGGGHALYVPLGGFDHAGCGADSALYQQFLSSADVGSEANCSGSSQVMVLGRDLTIQPDGEAWWGVATLFVNDNPSATNAEAFRERRRVEDVLAAFASYVAGRDARALHDAALAEHEAFRTGAMPSALSADERALWRQSETVLRMGQIREPHQPGRSNFGMMLAALPPGEWHTGWVRDASYAVAALAMTGHHQMARQALEFFLGADPQTRGFFNQGYLGQSYRVSATRYFGNGQEEGDFNADGPNVETDGFGLVLWAARIALHHGCDLGWLDTPTARGDTVYEGLREIAEDIETGIVDDLPSADASIWEVHWQRRQVFTFTAAAQARGLLDFAHIASVHGDTATAERMRQKGLAMRERMLAALVHAPEQSLVSHLGVAQQPAYVDGSTVEALLWELVPEDSAIYRGTLAGYARLATPFGGFQRLEPGLSLTGEGSANVYDASEWIFLDLRIAQALRRAGELGRADARLDFTTRAAAQNDHLLPELYERTTGDYQGAIPMVGYGAGVWMMAQLEKHGLRAPGPDTDLLHCLTAAGDDAGLHGSDGGAAHDGGTGAAHHDAGASMGGDAGSLPARGHDAGCSLSPRSTPWPPSWILASLLMLLFARRRQHRP
jgi:hypothetical protein